MKIKYTLLVIVLLLAALFLMPVNLTKTVTINANFLKVYQQLIGPGSWVKWHPDLKAAFNRDSSRVSFITKKGGYEINSPERKVMVNFAAVTFNIDDNDRNYSYFVEPGKIAKQTVVNVALKSNLLGYLKSIRGTNDFAETHISDFKKYLESDSLYYGYNIHKIRVPQSDLITVRKKVPASLQFVEAQKSYNELSRFIKEKGLKKMQPVIAQFIPVAGTDSVNVNVGFFIDKPVTLTGRITYVKMPKGGPLVVIDYNGKFYERAKAYTALKRFFADHIYQQGVMPFETYINDNLPKSENEKVDIRINFTSFQ